MTVNDIATTDSIRSLPQGMKNDDQYPNENPDSELRDKNCSHTNVDNQTSIDVGLGEIEQPDGPQAPTEESSLCNASAWNDAAVSNHGCLDTNCVVQPQENASNFFEATCQEDVPSSFPQVSTSVSYYYQSCQKDNTQLGLVSETFVDRQLDASYSEQEVAGSNSHVRNASCDVAYAPNRQQLAVDPCNVSMLQNDVPPPVPASSNNHPCSKMYKPSRVDCFQGPNSQVSLGPNTTAPLGHTYHGNGDIGSSSGYETQSNNSASPYTSPDSIASVNHLGNDVTNVSSAPMRHVDVQHSTSLPQGSMCRGNLVQPCPPQSQPSDPSAICSSNSESGEK